MEGVNKRREELKNETEDVSEEMQQLDELEKQYELLLPEIVHIPAMQKVVLVKWNNQSYDQVTWELESEIQHEQRKIISFHRNNRMPDAASLGPITYWPCECVRIGIHVLRLINTSSIRLSSYAMEWY